MQPYGTTRKDVARKYLNYQDKTRKKLTNSQQCVAPEADFVHSTVVFFIYFFLVQIHVSDSILGS